MLLLLFSAFLSAVHSTSINPFLKIIQEITFQAGWFSYTVAVVLMHMAHGTEHNYEVAGTYYKIGSLYILLFASMSIGRIFSPALCFADIKYEESKRKNKS